MCDCTLLDANPVVERVGAYALEGKKKTVFGVDLLLRVFQAGTARHRIGASAKHEGKIEGEDRQDQSVREGNRVTFAPLCSVGLHPGPIR